MIRPCLYVACALNLSFLAIALGCQVPAESRQCELREPCDAASDAGCVLVQCESDDTSYPDPSCESSEYVAAAAACGVDFCCLGITLHE